MSPRPRASHVVPRRFRDHRRHRPSSPAVPRHRQTSLLACSRVASLDLGLRSSSRAVSPAPWTSSREAIGRPGRRLWTSEDPGRRRSHPVGGRRRTSLRGSDWTKNVLSLRETRRIASDIWGPGADSPERRPRTTGHRTGRQVTSGDGVKGRRPRTEEDG